jgi:hypothetical protein
MKVSVANRERLVTFGSESCMYCEYWCSYCAGADTVSCKFIVFMHVHMDTRKWSLIASPESNFASHILLFASSRRRPHHSSSSTVAQGLAEPSCKRARSLQQRSQNNTSDATETIRSNAVREEARGANRDKNGAGVEHPPREPDRRGGCPVAYERCFVS